MEAKDRNLGSLWSRVLDTLPFPLILLDAQGNTLYLNRAGAADPVAARARAGPPPHGSDGREEESLQERVRRRQGWYEQALRTRAACCFEEEVREPGGEDRHLCWVYAPVVDSGGEVTEVVVFGFEATGLYRYTVAEAQRALVEQVTHEIQPPLASIASLGSTLAGELTGAQGERAALIDQNGQLLLRRLSALLSQMASASEERVA